MQQTTLNASSRAGSAVQLPAAAVRPVIKAAQRCVTRASLSSSSSASHPQQRCQTRQASQRQTLLSKRGQAQVCHAVILDGKLISRTEVPAFIQRDDMMDQLYRWTLMEGQEAGMRNFGAPMVITPQYQESSLWGFNIGIYREGIKLTDLGVQFDDDIVTKHEFVGKDERGMPLLEGRVDEIKGKHMEIWKLDSIPVDEDLRATIRSYCTALVSALNRYYAFGSVFVDDSQ
ncbi:MAG: hypothetical protein WDW38_004072 [Sanguina aurantia]